MIDRTEQLERMLKLRTDDWIEVCKEVDAKDREIERLKKRLARIRAHVDEQAEDDGLWSVPLNGQQPISEAYLQQELRRLHATVEANTDPQGRGPKPPESNVNEGHV